MNKLIKTISFALGLIFISISCDDNDNIVVDGENNIMAVVSVWKSPYMQEFSFYGNLIAKAICELNYVVLNLDTVFYNDAATPYYINDYNGNIYFSLNTDENNVPVEESVKIEIHTGAGIVSGYETLPDSVRNITYNLVDTVKIGDTLVMAFAGEADYFQIRYQYSYVNEDSTGIEYEYGMIYTNKCEVYFDSTLLNKNGRLSVFSIAAINGPQPEVNSVSNMQGDGEGFLSVWWYQYVDKVFTIGEGIHLP